MPSLSGVPSGFEVEPPSTTAGLEEGPARCSDVDGALEVALETVVGEVVTFEAVTLEAVTLEAVTLEAVTLDAVTLEAVTLEVVTLECVAVASAVLTGTSHMASLGAVVSAVLGTVIVGVVGTVVGPVVSWGAVVPSVAVGNISAC